MSANNPKTVVCGQKIKPTPNSKTSRLRIERLPILMLPSGLVQGIGDRSKHRREGRFAQAGGIHLAFHKMYLDALGRLAVADEAVLIEIALLGETGFINQPAVKRIPDTIHDGSPHHVGGRVGIHYHLTEYEEVPWRVILYTTWQGTHTHFTATSYTKSVAASSSGTK